jgi:aspartate kinase
MIIQNVSDENHTDISFTVTKEDLNKATKIVQELGKLVEARDISADPNICKVSIVGAGMRSHQELLQKCLALYLMKI